MWPTCCVCSSGPEATQTFSLFITFKKSTEEYSIERIRHTHATLISWDVCVCYESLVGPFLICYF